jgi:hypothetical protein
MKTHTYKDYTVISYGRGVWVVYLRGVRIPWPHYFRTFKKSQAWIDTHPPGWLPCYEKVRYPRLDGKDFILLRDPVVVGDRWFCGIFRKGPLLKGEHVNQDGSNADLLPFLIELAVVRERIPMRLDPYSKQLQELVEVTVE